MYKLSIDQNLYWEEIEIKGKKPDKRHGHAACCIDRNILIFVYELSNCACNGRV